jgi:hypothetical protein
MALSEEAGPTWSDADIDDVIAFLENAALERGWQSAILHDEPMVEVGSRPRESRGRSVESATGAVTTHCGE